MFGPQGFTIHLLFAMAHVLFILEFGILPKLAGFQGYGCLCGFWRVIYLWFWFLEGDLGAAARAHNVLKRPSIPTTQPLQIMEMGQVDKLGFEQRRGLGASMLRSCLAPNLPCEISRVV